MFRQSLCKAFGLHGEERSDVFDKAGGEEFLAREIGLEQGSNLPPVATEVVELVGYQKFALMMIGGMVAPLGKKKRSWSWDEVRSYVFELRAELCLP